MQCNGTCTQGNKKCNHQRPRNKQKMVERKGKKQTQKRMVWIQATWSSSTCNSSYAKYAFWCLLSNGYNTFLDTKASFNIVMMTPFSSISLWFWQKKKKKDEKKRTAEKQRVSGNITFSFRSLSFGSWLGNWGRSGNPVDLGIEADMGI